MRGHGVPNGLMYQVFLDLEGDPVDPQNLWWDPFMKYIGICAYKVTYVTERTLFAPKQNCECL